MKSIPKKCHFFWNGLPMTYLQTLGVVSFHKYNSEWEIIVHKAKQKPEEYGENRYIQEYNGVDFFHMIENLNYVKFNSLDLKDCHLPKDAPTIMATDLLRTYILHKEGGVYSDHDVIWLKPMSEFVNIDCIGNPSNFESTACLYKQINGHHNMSVMVSEQGSPFIDSIVQAQRRIGAPYSDQKFSAELLNSMYPNFYNITAKYPRVLGLQYKTFYPYSTFNMGQLFLEDDLSPIESQDVMCVHWFANNSVTREVVHNDKYMSHCSMSRILRQEGYL
jgi:hypothetical protein